MTIILSSLMLHLICLRYTNSLTKIPTYSADVNCSLWRHRRPFIKMTFCFLQVAAVPNPLPERTIFWSRLLLSVGRAKALHIRCLFAVSLAQNSVLMMYKVKSFFYRGSFYRGCQRCIPPRIRKFNSTNAELRLISRNSEMGWGG